MSDERATAIMNVIMRLIDRQRGLESELMALRSILHDRGIVTDTEVTEIQARIARLEEEFLNGRAGRSQEELLQEFPQKYEGPKQ